MPPILRPLLLLVPLSGCAALQPAPPAVEFITPENMRPASDWFGYSQAVRVGPWITVSAVPGFDIDKRGFPETYPEQVAKAFENLAAILAAAGAGMNDVVEITTYQLDMDRFNDTVDGKNEAFGAHRPAWTAVGVAGLPLASMQFQVSARAYAPARPGTSAAADQPKKERPPQRFMNRPGY